MLEEDIDEDRHFCIKCNASIIGLENYVQHRKNNCSIRISGPSSAPRSTELTSVASSPIVAVAASTSSTPSDNIVQSFSNFTFSEDRSAYIKSEHGGKSSKTLTDPYDLAYELGADVFFSSLELQSVQTTGPSTCVKTSNNAHHVLTRKTSSTQGWIEEPTSRNNSENLMKVVRNISGSKKIETVFKPISFAHESPEPSDDDEDEDVEDYNDEDYEPVHTVGKMRRSPPVVPSSHTGGKWKPEHRPNQLRLSPSWDERPTRSYSRHTPVIDAHHPPDDHTKGKWVPGTKLVKLEYNNEAEKPVHSQSQDFWCKICCRRLKTKLYYENHLKTAFHLKRAETEKQLEKASLKKIDRYDLSEAWQKSFTLAENEMSSPTAVTSLKRKRRSVFIKCEVCKHRIAKVLLGKHLISHYHYGRMSLNPKKSFNMILNNIHLVVLQSPFQCRPCRFYANTEETFLQHWNSPQHQDTTEGPGKFWCSYCHFECEDNNQMRRHLLGADHKEVILAINRSVPICISKKINIECPECNQCFKYNMELRKHFQQHHGCTISVGTASDTYQCCVKCNLCTDVFKSKTALQRHQKFRHKRSTFFCSICDLNFTTAIEAKKHRKTFTHRLMSARNQDNDKRHSLKCKICDFSSTSEVEAMLHEISHSAETEHPEEYSGLSVKSSSKTQSQFEEPMKSKNEKPNKISSIKKMCKSKKCNFCRKDFENIALLKQHIDEIHPDSEYKCMICGEGFSLLQMLGRHVKYKVCVSSSSSSALTKSSAVDQAPIDSSNNGKGKQCQFDIVNYRKMWKCRECAYSAVIEADLIFHQLFHTIGELSKHQKYKCPLCTKTFAKKSLRWHLRRHTNEKQFECTFCNKNFLRKHNLKDHIANLHLSKSKVMERQKSPKSFQCDVCGKVYQKKYSLKMHLINHSGNGKSFVCKVQGCKYVARDLYTLNVHMTSHSIKHDIQCKHRGCKYRGKSELHLKRHSKIHETPKRILKCSECDFKAKVPGHIKRHMRTHTGEKPYKCPHCDYISGFQENLRKHILTTSKHPGKFIYECEDCDPAKHDDIFKTNYFYQFQLHQASKHFNLLLSNDN